MNACTSPKFPSLPAALDHFVALAPDREAARDSAESIDYAGLGAAVARVAQRLCELGLRPGDRVAFLGTPGLPFWVSLLGSMRAGAVWLGLNPLHTPREMAHVVRDARPRLCLVDSNSPPAARDALRVATDHDAAPRIVQLATGVRSLLDALDALAAQPPVEDETSSTLARNDVCLIVYTSGTTGAPKGALLTGRGLVENGWWLARRMDFDPGRGLVNLPVNHIGCIGDLCATILVAGGTAVFMERFDARAAVRCITEQRLTWLGQVPAQFQLMLAKGGLEQADLSGVRHLLWGGAAMPEPLIRLLQERVADPFNGYGLTECSGTITLTGRGSSVAVLANTVGRAVDAALLRVADDLGHPVADGCSGEIQLRGPHVFAGYLNQPEASRACLTPDGWLKTGDLGAFHPDGNLSLLGRTSEMFKSGGYNVYPREIENVLEACKGVELCAVVAVPDALWDEVGVAFVQGDPAALTPESLARHCAEQLARYKVPKRFVVCSALPLLPVGKVDKQRLRVELGTVRT